MERLQLRWERDLGRMPDSVPEIIGSCIDKQEQLSGRCAMEQGSVPSDSPYGAIFSNLIICSGIACAWCSFSPGALRKDEQNMRDN